MDTYFLEYKFNSFFLSLLTEESNERNKQFNKFTMNDIYDLIYLSTGICGIYIRNNSLKILNKYIIYIEQMNINIIPDKLLRDMYNFLLNYDFTNQDHNTIVNEINHQIYIFMNLENFKNYINNDINVKNVLNNLCK